MAEITITVPDNKANKVYEAYKRAYGHDVENPTNGQKLAFVKGKLVDFLKNIVFSDEKTVAMNTAGNAVSVDDGVAS